MSETTFSSRTSPAYSTTHTCKISNSSIDGRRLSLMTVGVATVGVGGAEAKDDGGVTESTLPERGLFRGEGRESVLRERLVMVG